MYKKKVNYTLVNASDGKKKLVFVLKVHHYPTGGVIVSHNCADTVNDMHYKGFGADMLYAQETSFNPTLFPHKSPLRKNVNINAKHDFLIIPEAFIMFNYESLIKNKIPYAISVLNGYLMDLEVRFYGDDFEQLKKAYEHASVIISVSKDASENIKLVFPSCASKIIESSYVIDKAKFAPLEKKENIITYMPRKLGRHSESLRFFIEDKLPKHWKFSAIDGVPEQEVYDIFTRSKIFLSFSEFEGLAMPPVMAAMSGNHVIGYTGEGNKEYFHLPCFEEVYAGDLRDFANKVLKAVERFDQNQYQIDMPSIQYLTEKFSQESLERYLKLLIDKADEALSR